MGSWRKWIRALVCWCAFATGGLLSFFLPVCYDSYESCLGEGAELVEQGLRRESVV